MRLYKIPVDEPLENKCNIDLPFTGFRQLTEEEIVDRNENIRQILIEITGVHIPKFTSLKIVQSESLEFPEGIDKMTIAIK